FRPHEVAQPVKKLLVLLVLLGMALTGVAYWVSHPKSPLPAEDEYKFASAEFGSMTESVSATGLLQPTDVIAVGSELSGKVISIHPQADFNKTVEEGEPLLQLDDSMARQALAEADAAVASAEASVSAARADLARAEAGRHADQVKVTRLSELVRQNI